MNEQIIAALVWDKRVLVQPSAAEGARAFADAMDLRGGKWWVESKQSSAQDPLTEAAQAILREADGEVQLAVETYESLAQRPEPLVRLLGLTLRLWCGEKPTPSHFEEAEGLIEDQPDAELRARLILKLVAAAFDHGLDERIPELLKKALSWAPPGSGLHRAIEVESFNLLNWPLTLGDPPEEWDDDLTSYEWITDMAAEAAKSRLMKVVEDKADSPRMHTQTFGAAPLNRPFAAERQVRWAGAIWLSRDVQLQLAAHLLATEESDPEMRASAVALWILHGGKRVEGVVAVAEADFDPSSGDRVLEVLSRGGDLSYRFELRLLEAALACWDLISTQTCMALLDRFEPRSSDQRSGDRIASLWSVLSLRVPEEWERRFLKLSDEGASSLLATTMPAVAKRLPQKCAARLLDLIEKDSNLAEPRLYAALCDRLGEQPVKLAASRSGELLSAAALDGTTIDISLVQEAVDHMIDSLKDLIGDARRGKFGLGRSNPVAELAFGIELLGGEHPQGTVLLKELASDGAMPRNLRFDALRGLLRLVVLDIISDDELGTIATAAPEGGAEALWDDYPPSLIRATKSTLMALTGDAEAALPSLVALSRDSTIRVRREAIEGSGVVFARMPSSLLEGVLMGGLFDPNSHVIQAAIAGIFQGTKISSGAGLAIGERLKALYRRGGREVRITLVSLLSESDPESGPFPAVRKDVLDQATRDRSFQVRDVVTRREHT